MKAIELAIERIIFASRWTLVVFYLGLGAALAAYAVAFLFKFYKLVGGLLDTDEAGMILAMLNMIDAALVASLIVTVMLAGYDNFVSRFDEASTELSWLGKLDAGSLKVKVASAIVAISSIHLLQVFLNANTYENEKIMWLTIMHMAFVASAVFLALLDRLMSGGKEH